METITASKENTELESFTQETVEIMLVENQGMGPTDIFLNRAKVVKANVSGDKSQ